MHVCVPEQQTFTMFHIKHNVTSGTRDKRPPTDHPPQKRAGYTVNTVNNPPYRPLYSLNSIPLYNKRKKTEQAHSVRSLLPFYMII